MKRRVIAAQDAPQAAGGYAQAVEVSEAKRSLFVSGQIPVSAAGALPEGFEAQAQLAWQNVIAQLRAADMSLDDLVKVNIYLSDRAYALPNRAVRAAVLGDRKVAMTVVICDIFDAGWLLEIEALAMS